MQNETNYAYEYALTEIQQLLSKGITTLSEEERKKLNKALSILENQKSEAAGLPEVAWIP